MAKIIFLSYANSRTNPLKYLSEEDEGMYAAVANLNLRNDFDVHRDQYATVDTLTKYLEFYKNDMVLFHFSGHAGQTNISLDDMTLNAKGITYQLQDSVRSGVLKLVVLNGCSTVGQVKRLLEIGVPAVITTHAAVDDRAASIFGVNLMKNLNERGMNIRDSFLGALEKAETVRDLNREKKEVRSLDYLNQLDDNAELWELFTNDPHSADINPFSVSSKTTSSYVPNEKLLDVLFESLAEAGNADIIDLKNKETRVGYIESADKKNAIVNVLPFPIAIHLQKLLCLTEDDDDGYNKAGRNRMNQICELFHMCMEFMGFIMLAQLWEVKLKDHHAKIPDELIDTLRKYFYLGVDDRKTYDYFPLIRTIRQYFDSFNGNGIKYFIEELELLKEISVDGHPFCTACTELTTLYTRSVKNEVNEVEATQICEKAENWLCDFLKNLRFIHRYNLTSVQKISIRKYRHDLKTQFNHYVVRLMRAVGSSEQNIYLRHSNLDNPGVILFKGSVEPIRNRKGTFLADDIDFLNISPFIIDKNAFESDTNLSDILFFQLFNKANNEYSFKNVKKPNVARDGLLTMQDPKYEGIQLQFDAFRSMILNEDLTK